MIPEVQRKNGVVWLTSYRGILLVKKDLNCALLLFLRTHVDEVISTAVTDDSEEGAYAQ